MFNYSDTKVTTWAYIELVVAIKFDDGNIISFFINWHLENLSTPPTTKYCVFNFKELIRIKAVLASILILGFKLKVIITILPIRETFKFNIFSSSNQ